MKPVKDKVGDEKKFANGVYDLAPAAKTPSAAPFRPVQWLGSKLRAAPAILEVAQSLAGGGVAVDLFSGSSVVGQALAHRGRVIAVDAMQSCAIMAGAMLGVGRRQGEVLDPVLTARLVAEARRLEAFDSSIFSSQLLAEKRALSSKNAQALSILEAEYPVAWRQPSWSDSKWAMPMLTSLFAGSYFGLSQSIAIDGLRRGLNELRTAGALSEWQHSAFLTALLGVCSEIVYSAGKHFAQPLTASAGKDLAFRNTRRLKDRGYDVFTLFERYVVAVSDRAIPGANRNDAVCATEDRVHDRILAERPALVYADPPYTAQQYSRFYHVLETVASYQRPDLGQKVTAGIYPVDRYNSPYCSRRRAPGAFKTLIDVCASAGSVLALSYSSSSSDSKGNLRMVSLDDLTQLCRSAYGERSVTVMKLDHSYRQFNSTFNRNALRSDPEVLIICE